MSKKSRFLSRQGIEAFAIFLADIFTYKAYDIRQVILQLDSIDDTLVVLYEAQGAGISLNEAVYLRLRGRDEHE